ncbi:MAG: GNAT family protein [Erysipelothrix sp.]
MGFKNLFQTKADKEKEEHDYFLKMFPFGERHQELLKETIDNAFSSRYKINPNIFYYYLLAKEAYIDNNLREDIELNKELDVMNDEDILKFKDILMLDVKAKSLTDIENLSGKAVEKNNLTGFEIKPTLVGERVILRKFEDNDIDRMIEIIQIPEVGFLTGSAITSEELNRKRTPEDLERYRQWYKDIQTASDRLDLAITVDGEVLGEIVLNEWDPEMNAISFRILMDPSHASMGYGSEAMTLFLNYAFKKFNFNRIELEVYSFNPRARRAYEKVGFVYEGTKREAFQFDKVKYDIEFFSILRKDRE